MNSPFGGLKTVVCDVSVTCSGRLVLSFRARSGVAVHKPSDARSREHGLEVWGAVVVVVLVAVGWFFVQDCSSDSL